MAKIESASDALMLDPENKSNAGQGRGGRAGRWYSENPSHRKGLLLLGGVVLGVAATWFLGQKVFEFGSDALEHLRAKLPVDTGNMYQWMEFFKSLDPFPDTPDTGAVTPVPQEDVPPPPPVEYDPNDPSNPVIEKPKFADRPIADVPPVHETTKPTFVSDDTYDLSERNLSQNGYTNEVRIDTPNQDEVWGLEDAADDRGVDLSPREAALALENGGFVKDGVTYEIWRDPEDPSKFLIVKCDADHELVGKVPDLDKLPPEEPRDYTCEADRMDQNTDTQGEAETTDESGSEYDDEYEGGYDDGDYSSGYDDEYEDYGPEGYDPYVERIMYLHDRFFPGVPPSFFASPNPFYPYGMSAEQYDAYNEIQAFLYGGR